MDRQQSGDGNWQFNEMLRDLREKAGLSQTALARLAGMEASSINRLERESKRRPRKSTTLKLIRGLGLAPTDERAHQLLLAAGKGSRQGTGTDILLGSPLSTRTAADPKLALEATMREMRKAVLHTLNLLDQLDQCVKLIDD